MAEYQSRSINYKEYLASIERVTPPFRLRVSYDHVKLPFSQMENSQLLLAGITTKKAISEIRVLSPDTIHKELVTLYKYAGMLQGGDKKVNYRKITTIATLFRAGAYIQVPSHEDGDIPQEYWAGRFSTNLPKDENGYALPYDLVLSDAFKDLSPIQLQTIEEILHGKTTNKEIGDSVGRNENTIKKRFGATPLTHNSLRNLIIGLTGDDTGQRLGRVEIFLKLLEFGIIRQIPINKY